MRVTQLPPILKTFRREGPHEEVTKLKIYNG